MKKIAVITACHNSEKYIQDTLTSVSLLNTFSQFTTEHIIIDDASDDKTAQILKSYPSQHLKLHFLSENKGPSFARNYGIQRSNADYIFCLDSDDVIFQNSIFNLFTELESKKLEWAYGDFIRCDEKLSYLIGQDYYGWHFHSTEEVLTALFTNQHFFQHNCMFTKELFLKAGMYDEDMYMAEDFDLYTRMLLLNSNPIYLPGPLYLHRFHANNLSKKYTQHPQENMQIIARMYNGYKDQLKKKLSQDDLIKIEGALRVNL